VHDRDLGEAQRRNFAKAVKAGVKMTFGTDAGVCPHGIGRTTVLPSWSSMENDADAGHSGRDGHRDLIGHILSTHAVGQTPASVPNVILTPAFTALAKLRRCASPKSRSCTRKIRRGGRIGFDAFFRRRCPMSKIGAVLLRQRDTLIVDERGMLDRCNAGSKWRS